MEEEPKTKEQQIYIESIVKLLKVCDDLELLDLIFKLLDKKPKMR